MPLVCQIKCCLCTFLQNTYDVFYDNMIKPIAFCICDICWLLSWHSNTDGSQRKGEPRSGSFSKGCWPATVHGGCKLSRADPGCKTIRAGSQMCQPDECSPRSKGSAWETEDRPFSISRGVHKCTCQWNANTIISNNKQVSSVFDPVTWFMQGGFML